MIVYLNLIVLILVLNIFCYLNEIKPKKATFCVFTGALLYIVVALRDVGLGMRDTEFVYVPFFKQILKHDFLTILLNYKDALFYIIIKLFSLINENVHFLLAVVAIPLIASVTYLIYIKSERPLLSFILFISLSFYGLACFTTLRHGVALAVTILAMFKLEEGNKKGFLLYTILASLFHQTAIIFLVTIVIYNNKIFEKYRYILILFCFGISLFADTFVVSIIKSLAESFSRYEFFITNINSIGYTSFLINLMIVLMYDFFSFNQKSKSNYLNLVVMGCCLSAFSSFMQEFNRLAMFFTIFEIILLPNCINNVKKYRLILGLVIGSVLLVYFFFFSIYNTQINDYTFFFNYVK